MFLKPDSKVKMLLELKVKGIVVKAIDVKNNITIYQKENDGWYSIFTGEKTLGDNFNFYYVFVIIMMMM